jgi:Protein of unknown function (DUF4232)
MAIVAPPPHSEAEALIKEARARQLRRRLLAAAGLAIGAAIGLSLYAFTTRGGYTRPAGDSAGLAPPVCRASRLSASFGTGGAGGLALGGLVLGNTGSRPCSLPVGRPIVQVIFRSKPLPAQERPWDPSEQFGARAGHILGPGKKAFFEIGWRGWCPNPSAAPTSPHATLSVRFRGGLRLAVPDTPDDRNGVSLPGCGEPLHPAPWIAVSRLLRYP